MPNHSIKLYRANMLTPAFHAQPFQPVLFMPKGPQNEPHIPSYSVVRARNVKIAPFAAMRPPMPVIPFEVVMGGAEKTDIRGEYIPTPSENARSLPKARSKNKCSVLV